MTDFPFPTASSKVEDFAGINVLTLKDYYKEYFLRLITSVRYISDITFYVIVWER